MITSSSVATSHLLHQLREQRRDLPVEGLGAPPSLAVRAAVASNYCSYLATAKYEMSGLANYRIGMSK